MLSIRNIVAEVKRSNGCGYMFLKTRRRDCRTHIAKNAKNLSNAHKRAVIREACNGKLSERQLNMGMFLPVGVRRVQKHFSLNTTTAVPRNAFRPKDEGKKQERPLKYFSSYGYKGFYFWDNIVFSDGKKFNLDGPDGLALYWNDLRTELRRFSTRQQGGKSVMFWGAISPYGFSPLGNTIDNQDSKEYCNTLKDPLMS